MNTTHRDYSESAGDFNLLARFVIENNQVMRARSTWSLGRLADWRYGLYDNKTAYPAFWDENAHLWFDGYGYLIGFAICENGDAEFALVTLEGYQFLFEAMLQWVLEHWRGRGPEWSIELAERQDRARPTERDGRSGPQPPPSHDLDRAAGGRRGSQLVEQADVGPVETTRTEAHRVEPTHGLRTASAVILTGQSSSSPRGHHTDGRHADARRVP